MKSGDITGVTGVPELTWSYNRNSAKAPKVMRSNPGVRNNLWRLLQSPGPQEPWLT